jgi:hypothetical protein
MKQPVMRTIGRAKLKITKCKPLEPPSSSANSGLLAAETTLEKLSAEMADEYQKYGAAWPRGLMQRHVKERQTLIDARNIILDRLGS